MHLHVTPDVIYSLRKWDDFFDHSRIEADDVAPFRSFEAMLDGKNYNYKVYRGAVELPVLKRFANLKDKQPLNEFARTFKRYFEKA